MVCNQQRRVVARKGFNKRHVEHIQATINGFVYLLAGPHHVLHACCRSGTPDQGQQQVNEDCCAWELLQLCYLLAPHSEGIVIQV